MDYAAPAPLNLVPTADPGAIQYSIESKSKNDNLRPLDCTDVGLKKRAASADNEAEHVALPCADERNWRLMNGLSPRIFVSAVFYSWSLRYEVRGAF